MSQIPTLRRMWAGLKNSFKTPSKQIPTPPTTSADTIPDRTVHIGKYSCSIFPGTKTKDKAKRRKANRISYKSLRFNQLRTA